MLLCQVAVFERLLFLNDRGCGGECRRHPQTHFAGQLADSAKHQGRVGSLCLMVELWCSMEEAYLLWLTAFSLNAPFLVPLYRSIEKRLVQRFGAERIVFKVESPFYTPRNSGYFVVLRDDILAVRSYSV